MNIPEGFYQFSGFLYPGSLHEYDSQDEWIAANLGWLSAQDRMEIKRFLDGVLDGPYSDAELADIWNCTGPVYNFRPGDHRLFFAMIRDLIK
ncbi:MAG: hypothetical protein ACXWVL_06015 [Rhodoplanes sp.]|jgi:hypothetical protein